MPQKSGSRRSSAEVRALIVAGAGRLFDEKGFDGTALDEVARESGVARSVVYRHFASKSELYVDAVLQPFVDLQKSYLTLWQQQADQPWDDDRYMRGIVTLIYDTCTLHRNVINGLLSARQSLDPDTADRLRTSVGGVLDQLVATVQPESDRRGWVPPESLELSLKLMFGAVVSVSALRDTFLGPDESSHPDRDAVIDHVTRLFLYGAGLDRPR
ncbi:MULTISPECIES: TetR/AcrR family transcriptional regulator [unclassified Pseudonocardia]|uniref:TetR/AcrR family transcriptional regulator n=1 Tax=unclassified Pseudonocardia TaxID=2619320 RepID=UPI0009F8F6F4|nr:TetR/AcrR family transcriptional regulator [Pseudonocardia sp. Ae707_Ps1]